MRQRLSLALGLTLSVQWVPDPIYKGIPPITQQGLYMGPLSQKWLPKSQESTVPIQTQTTRWLLEVQCRRQSLARFSLGSELSSDDVITILLAANQEVSGQSAT